MSDQELRDFKKDLITELDTRYKKITECNEEMNAVRKSDSDILVALAEIKTTVETHKWLWRTALGAAICSFISSLASVIILISRLVV